MENKNEPPSPEAAKMLEELTNLITEQNHRAYLRGMRGGIQASQELLTRFVKESPNKVLGEREIELFFEAGKTAVAMASTISAEDMHSVFDEFDKLQATRKGE